MLASRPISFSPPCTPLDVQLDLRSEATPELSVETVEPTSTFEVSRGRLPMPAIGAVESSGHGVVIKAQAGSAIKAVHGGRVSKVLHVSGYGLVCILSHGGEWHTVYGHASAFSVRAGQNVESGEVIGSVGDSGSLDGPRLHFEVRQDRSPEDPLEWLNVPPGLAPSSR